MLRMKYLQLNYQVSVQARIFCFGSYVFHANVGQFSLIQTDVKEMRKVAGLKSKLLHGLNCHEKHFNSILI